MDAATLKAMLIASQAKLAERDARIAERDAHIAERDARIAAIEEEQRALTLRHTQLWKTYERLKEELALVKQRLFVAKAERVDTSQLQLEFEELSAELDRLAGELDDIGRDAAVDTAPKRKAKPKGRRAPADLSHLPKETVRITDPVMEQLVERGDAKVLSVESSSQVGYQRGGYRHIVTERVKYITLNKRGEAEFETAAVPQQLIPRCLAAPSTLAHIAVSKFVDGLPLYRQEEILSRDGITIDRGSMSRWMETLGGTFGATIVEAMDKDARDNAFCILTDATGFAIQPARPEKKKSQKRTKQKRRPCRRGHYFVRIADADHVLFDYTARHTKDAVWGLFRDFDGYIQADASSVYDVLFRSGADRAKDDPEDDGCARTEVGCWSHARRKYWEAAMAKSVVARSALMRIGKMFALDAKIRHGKPPPSKIKKLRDEHLRPLVDEFLEFARSEYDKVENERGSLRSALGYSVRQAAALRAFLGDGRLRMDNNPSEGQLRKLVRVRDAALFAGSDKHAESAAGILSLVASARLHGLHPETYLRDIIRVLPFWPKDRYLELAPNHWAATRARLDAAQIDAEVGHIDVPDVMPASDDTAQ